MSQFFANNELTIIDVPPELRGWSDEEIIKNSEKTIQDFQGKRKNGALRPSKRDREALKIEKERLEAEQIATEIFSSAPKTVSHQDSVTPAFPQGLSAEKEAMLKTAFTPESPSYSFIHTTGRKDSVHATPKSSISEPPKPTSGRVLKASFGFKGADKPKAVIVSAADLAKQKAEERAKKIQTLFRTRHPEAKTAPDGTPIKRPRGRPRKNPLPPPTEQP